LSNFWDDQGQALNILKIPIEKYCFVKRRMTFNVFFWHTNWGDMASNFIQWFKKYRKPCKEQEKTASIEEADVKKILTG